MLSLARPHTPWMACFALLFAGSVAAASSVSAEESSSEAALLQEARQQLLAGQTDAAITTLKRAERVTDGRSVEVLLLRAVAENVAGEAQDAIDAAEAVLELGPDPESAAAAHFQIGSGWLQRAKPRRSDGPWKDRYLRRAEEAFRQIIAGDDPRSLDARAYLGWVIVLRESSTDEPPAERYAEAMRYAAQRYAAGTPGAALDLARVVLCGSTTCEPYESRHRLHDQDEPTDLARCTLQPKKVYSPRVQFTELTRRFRVRGPVVLRGKIDPSGRFVVDHVDPALPLGLTEHTIEQVSNWRFEPPTCDGEPSTIPFSLVVSFSFG